MSGNDNKNNATTAVEAGSADDIDSKNTSVSSTDTTTSTTSTTTSATIEKVNISSTIKNSNNSNNRINASFVEPPCGQKGPCDFYKSFSYTVPNKGPDFSQQILSVGEFFFVRIAPHEICIAELQLLWKDKNRELDLSSSRLYFLPRNMTDLSLCHYGQDEVLSMSGKVVLRLEDLITWITTDVRWDKHRQALLHCRNNSILSNNSSNNNNNNSNNKNNLHRYRNNNHRHNNDHNNTNNKNSTNSESNSAGKSENGNSDNNNNSDEKKVALVDKMVDKDPQEPNKCQRANGGNVKETSSGGSSSTPGSEGQASVTVLSYPRYCRYRAILKRLEEVSDSWVKNSIVRLLGGFDCPDANHRVVFCRDTIDRPDIEQDEHLCNHLAPNLKGRPRKKRLKTSRGHSPSSESNTSEEAPGPSSQEVSAMPTAREARATNRLNKVRIQNHRNGHHKSPEESRKEEEFLEKLFHFMRERNTPIERVPHLGFKQINLYLFYTFAQNLGGYDKVTIKRLWKQIYDVLGGSPGSTSAATCTRRHYERLLLPYERHNRGEADKPIPPPSKFRRLGSHHYLKHSGESTKTTAPSLSTKAPSVKEADGAADRIKTNSPTNRISPSPTTATVASTTTSSTDSVVAQPKTLNDDCRPQVSSAVTTPVSSTTILASSMHAASSDNAQQPSPQPASPFIAPCVTPTLPSAEVNTHVAEEANDGVPEAKIPSSGSQEWEEAQTRQLSLARKPHEPKLNPRRKVSRIKPKRLSVAEVVNALRFDPIFLLPLVLFLVVSQSRNKLKDERITEKERQWEEIRRQNALERDRVKQLGHGTRPSSSSRLSKLRDSLPQLSPVTPPDLTTMDSLSQPESGTHLRQAGSMDHSPPPHLEPQLPPPLPSPDPTSVAGKDGSESKRRLSPALANSPSPTAQLPPPPPLVDLTRVVNTLQSSKVLEGKRGSSLGLLPLKRSEPEASTFAASKNAPDAYPDKNRHFEASYQQFLLSTAAAAYAEREQIYHTSSPHPANRDSTRHSPASVPVVKTEAKWIPRPSSATAFSPWSTSSLAESPYSSKPLSEPTRKLSVGAVSNPSSSNSCSPTLNLLARPSVIQHTPSASKSMSPSPSLSQRSSSASPSPHPSPSLTATSLANYRPSTMPSTTSVHHLHSRTAVSNFMPSSNTVSSTATSTVGSFQYYQMYAQPHHAHSHSHTSPSHLVSSTPELYRDSAKKPRLDSPLFTSPQYYPAPKLFVQPQGYHGNPYIGQYYMAAPTYTAPSSTSSASCDDEVLDLSMKKIKREKEDKSEESAKTSSHGSLPVQYVNPLPEFERVTPPDKELDLSIKSRSFDSSTSDTGRYVANSLHSRIPHSVSGLRNSGYHSSGVHNSRYHSSGLQNVQVRNSGVSDRNHNFATQRVPLSDPKKDGPYPTTPRVMASVVPIVQTDVFSKSGISSTAAVACTTTVSSSRNRTPDVKNSHSESKPEQVLAVSSVASDHAHSSKQPYYTSTQYGSSPFYASSLYSVSPQFMSSPSSRQFMTSEQIQASITAYKDMYHHQQHTQSLYGTHYPYAIASQLYPHLHKEGGQQYLYPPK